MKCKGGWRRGEGGLIRLLCFSKLFLLLSLDAQRKEQRKCTTADKYGIGYRPLHVPALASLAPQPQPHFAPVVDSIRA